MDPHCSWNALANIATPKCNGFVILYDNIRNSLFAIKDKLELLKYSFNTDSWTKYQIQSSSNTSLLIIVKQIQFIYFVIRV